MRFLFPCRRDFTTTPLARALRMSKFRGKADMILAGIRFCGRYQGKADITFCKARCCVDRLNRQPLADMSAALAFELDRPGDLYDDAAVRALIDKAALCVIGLHRHLANGAWSRLRVLWRFHSRY
jgi:hypothetical protein